MVPTHPLCRQRAVPELLSLGTHSYFQHDSAELLGFQGVRTLLLTENLVFFSFLLSTFFATRHRDVKK